MSLPGPGEWCLSPSHHWHLGPVTADRAEERSAAGCFSQSRSLEINRGKSRESSLHRLLTRLLWREIEGFHLHYCQHLASLPVSEIHSNGWEEGGGRRKVEQARQSKQPQYLGSGNFQLENILKNRRVELEETLAKPMPLFCRGDFPEITKLLSGRTRTRIVVFYHSKESFGGFSLKPQTGRGPPFVGAQQRQRVLTKYLGERAARLVVTGPEVSVPCGLKPRGTRLCSSTVESSFSAALELLGGTALLPPKVVPGVPDILSF